MGSVPEGVIAGDEMKGKGGVFLLAYRHHLQSGLPMRDRSAHFRGTASQGATEDRYMDEVGHRMEAFQGSQNSWLHS